MKSSLLLVAMFCASIGVAPAQAAQVAMINLGTVSDGTSSTTYADDNLFSATYFGSLPGLSRIVFTYTLDSDAAGALGAWPTASLSSLAYEGLTGVAAMTSVYQPEKVSSDDMLVATAYLPSYSYGQATITNLGSDPIQFQTTLLAWLSKAVGMTVAVAVSSVPLPAALPLFGLGLASLAGFRARKKKEKIAA